MWSKVTGIIAGLMLPVLVSSAAFANSCPIAGQSEMLVVQLFFGQSISGKGRLPERSWNQFLRDAVTPRFPDGFTVVDSYGQWRDNAASKIVREHSKMIEVAAEDSPDLRRKVSEIAALYRTRFHQQSVGIVTVPGCGAF